MTKLVLIDPKDYEERGVSQTLRHAVEVLNQALAIDATTVKCLLDTPYIVKGDVEKEFLEHPTIILREMGPLWGGSGLTALGLLAGCVNTGTRHRLAVTEEDGGSWSGFCIMEEV